MDREATDIWVANVPPDVARLQPGGRDLRRREREHAPAPRPV
jgi:hypothetical protein